MCPWSSAWSLTFLSLNVKQISAQRSWCSWSYPWEQWFSCEHGWISGLLLFFFSLSGLILLLAVERAGSVLPPCLCVQINMMSCCMVWVQLISLLIIVIMIYSDDVCTKCAIIRVSVDVLWPFFGIGMWQAVAFLLVPDTYNPILHSWPTFEQQLSSMHVYSFTEFPQNCTCICTK